MMVKIVARVVVMQDAPARRADCIEVVTPRYPIGYPDTALPRVHTTWWRAW